MTTPLPISSIVAPSRYFLAIQLSLLKGKFAVNYRDHMPASLMEHWVTPASTSEPLESGHSVVEGTNSPVNRTDARCYLNGHEASDEWPHTDHRISRPGSSSDLIIITDDHCHYYLDSETLYAVTNNNFNHTLDGFTPGGQTGSDAKPVSAIPETSSVFNILVCAIYGLTYSNHIPSFKTLDQAVDAMQTYGIAVERLIVPGTPLFDSLFAHAKTHALELYALAAHNSLHALAVEASAHLDSSQLSTLSDEIAVRIGALYLKRLFFMHLDGAEELRRLLDPLLCPGQPIMACGCEHQLATTWAWALASSSLVWDRDGMHNF
ncbi:hypothetical protein HWV62_43886 [Athelia sp. TMB]|nr:hypothetical protein HWV62_43886 [Athelia sp. TMB]